MLYYTNTLLLYSEPGIEATACARELLYVYVFANLDDTVTASRRHFHQFLAAALRYGQED